MAGNTDVSISCPVPQLWKASSNADHPALLEASKNHLHLKYRSYIMLLRELPLLAALASSVYACQRDFNVEKRHTHRKPLVKRNEEWPPVLDENETLLVNSFDNVSIDEWSRYYGYQNKLAGFGKEAAQWTADRWSENGFESHLNEYHVYLRYPVSASLQFTGEGGESEVVNIEEDVLEEDEVTGFDAISQQTWLGYSPTGNATAEYVYVG